MKNTVYLVRYDEENWYDILGEEQLKDFAEYRQLVIQDDTEQDIDVIDRETMTVEQAITIIINDGYVVKIYETM